MKIKRPSPAKARRPSSRYVTTRSGNVLKVHRSMGEKYMASREAKARRKVDRMRGLPKSRFKRFFWKFHPKRLAAYWFSRDGGIMALKLTGIGILALFILMLGVFAFFRKDLPAITDISGSNLGGSISYYDKTGQTLLWQDYDAVKRVTAQSSEISQFVKDATVATEDRNFYNERGFDVKGITRAAVNNLSGGSGRQGGSTITQQLVKLTLEQGQPRSVSRKVKELILAVELERSYTKDEILTSYLNAAPYGGVDYGVKTAAGDYFHKAPKDLTLPEAAMLATIPKSPSVYSPYAKDYFDKPAFLARYKYVLDSMVQTRKITKAKADVAKKYDVLAEVQPVPEKYAGIQAPYFVLSAKSEVNNRWATSSKVGGWKVITTLDMGLQNLAETTVQDNRKNALSHGADEEALAAEDVKTGQMVALVGGTDFNDPEHGKINYAQWNVSPGSSFKPYDYTSLIENSNNAGAGSVIYDAQTALPGYPCTIKGLPPPQGQSNCLQDFDRRNPGPITLRYALGGSRNIPAVKAMLITGTNKVISTANALMASPNEYKCYNPGVDVNTASKADESACYGASGIGDGAYLHLDKHVNGVATLARLGKALPSTYILKIYDSKSSTKPFYEWKQPKGTQVVRQDSAYIVDNMASDPNPSYLPTGFYKWHNYNGWRSAIKTGTTANAYDGLMMSWNTQYAVGSWVGYHTRNQPLTGSMELSTTPLTRTFMTKALDALHTTPVNWVEPSDIQHLPGYVIASHVGYGSIEPSPATEIYPSWYKPKGASTTNAALDKVSNKLATSCTPPLAKQTQSGNNGADRFSVDIYTGAGAANNGNTGANDDVHACGDDKPTITLTVTDNTSGDSNVCNVSCTIAAAVSQGTHPFDDPQYPQFPGTVNFSVGGSVVKSLPTTGALSFTYTPTAAGDVSVSAQVIDSVLYDATDAATVTMTLGTPMTFNSAHFSGGTTKFNWSGGSDPYTVYDGGVALVGCIAVTPSNCQTPGNLTGHTVTVKDNNGASVSKQVT